MVSLHRVSERYTFKQLMWAEELVIYYGNLFGDVSLFKPLQANRVIPVGQSRVEEAPVSPPVVLAHSN